MTTAALVTRVLFISPTKTRPCPKAGGNGTTERLMPLVASGSQQCPLLAQSGHSTTEFRCLLLGVKRTLVGGAAMSAFDPKRTLVSPKSRNERLWNRAGQLT